MAEQFKFTYLVERPSATRSNLAGRAKTMNAIADAVEMVSTALYGASVNYRINQELKRLTPQINRRMPTSGGVLVCLLFVGPPVQGHPAPTMLNSMHIAGSGASAMAVYQRYKDTPRMTQGVSGGSLMTESFIWVTRRR